MRAPAIALTLATLLPLLAATASATAPDYSLAGQEGENASGHGYVFATYVRPSGQTGPLSGAIESTCSFDQKNALDSPTWATTLVGWARAEAAGLDRAVSVGVRCALLDGAGNVVLLSQAAESGSVGHTSAAALLPFGHYSVCTQPSAMWSTGGFTRPAEACQA